MQRIRSDHTCAVRYLEERAKEGEASTGPTVVSLEAFHSDLVATDTAF